ncbi:hypothetical protein M2459_000368 [Parabacteroides sp. PF5-5]|uniref:hypothetical protein n=1 Tax=unclassified Parabacteroides TaxID=2649774 RepID=UPI00247559D3|nr:MULTISPECIES: hypothetical protein [unclassified Parabacteroides]MDH6306381.1 hypothetical protein [Parabacteroides sp. PH5-39]MDH6314653.1 hypothetical protein [Parabacteroides sp. PF5-13]MDH6321092.1 hypothetical protein [Parabacteroides sp. PH5-13]MDH6324824.1 hypothetical protein [Parabacteroides sp. PH5-8]MDH6325495.1 hypothetical protein [Parabacteroides sp. PH5-41]
MKMKKVKFFCGLLGIVCMVLLTAATVGDLFEGSGDVGAVKLKGSVHYNPTTQTYLLTGGGTNMWGNSDEFFMVWRKEKGDFSLSAKVGFVGDGVDAHRKLGIIIRESLTGKSRYADVCVHGDGLTSLQYRDLAGQETKEVQWEGKAPDHITLERIGKRIVMKTATGAYTDEVTGEIELELPETCYIGLFVCSHNPDILETVYFSKLIYKKL